MGLQKSKLFVAAGLLLSLAAHSAVAQEYPSRPVTIIAPYAPAGSIDLLTRALRPALEASLKQTVIVENRAGAGGKIGMQAMMRSPADGYTLSVINHAIATYLPAMDPNFVIKPEKDYLPVGLFAESYYILVRNPNAPFKTLPEMIEYAKKNPGQLRYASSGIGVGAHIGFELLAQVAGFKATHVPYQGEGPALTDVIAGHIPVMFLTGIAKPYLDDGKLVPMATTNATRWPMFPNVPTVAEQGYPNYLLKAWYGFAVPTGTPPAVVNKLNQTIKSASSDPQAIKAQEDLGNVLKASTRKELEDYINSDIERWSKVAKQADIKLQ